MSVKTACRDEAHMHGWSDDGCYFCVDGAQPGDCLAAVSARVDLLYLDWAGTGSPTRRCRGCDGWTYRKWPSEFVHDPDCTGSVPSNQKDKP